MTDVAAAFPSISKARVVRMLLRHQAHPTVIRWVRDWLTDWSIETWIDGRLIKVAPINCGVPQGSPCSPVLFAPTLAEALEQTREGVSYVDDCSWVISFNAQRDFKREAVKLLDEVHKAFTDHGFTLDKDKTEVAWIPASERPGAKQRDKATTWNLRWQGITRQFDIKVKLTRWLGFFVDCRMNWQAHIRHRLALGHHRLRTTARVMTANGAPRKLARKIAWAVAMSTAAYGVEAHGKDKNGSSKASTH